MSTTLPAQVGISYETIFNMLVGAFEGGSNYWYKNLTTIGSLERSPELDAKIAEMGLTDWGNLCNRYYRAILLGEGCTCEVDDYDDPIHPINLARIQEGLALMSQKAPQHFGDMVSGNDDATTADVFLQYVVLGDLIFG